ncbi:MAG TPA: ATP synthase subunit I [Bacilli bacterium]
MDEFSAHLKAVSKVSLVFLGICLLGWFAVPRYHSYFAGLLLGAAASWINSMYLALKIRLAADAVLRKTGKKVNIGFVPRAAISLLAVLVSLEAEDIAFSTTLAGLFFTQLVTLLLGIIANIRNRHG